AQREADRREQQAQREADRREQQAQREADRREMAELRSTVTALVQIVEVHQRNHEASERNFERIWHEIRGIRTETQRIIEHLFGTQQENGG
ncbi:MAG TPA: hypothetical protein DC064_02190, partial [Cyanobacteria bacterium UBA9273]|nr:hypothetical protein [Cyanobacteria bacterium UBA9273]